MRNTFDAREGGRVTGVRRLSVVAGAFVLTLSAPSVARADMAIPAAVLIYPGAIVMLIPIVLIEAWVLVWLLEVRARRALGVSAAANAVSTLIGVPVAGLLSVPFPPLTWIGSVDPAFPWWRPWIAITVVFVVFFLASWLTEYLVSRRMLREFDPRRVNLAVFLGNLATYALLGLLYFVWLGVLS